MAKTFKKHPAAIAWDEFSSSEEGQKSLEGRTIKLPLDQAQYLENRIRSAFQAGWNAHEKTMQSCLDFFRKE